MLLPTVISKETWRFSAEYVAPAGTEFQPNTVDDERDEFEPEFELELEFVFELELDVDGSHPANMDKAKMASNADTDVAIFILESLSKIIYA